MDGKGHYIGYKNGKTFQYQGEMKNSKFYGFGKLWESIGGFYEGEIVDGLKNGDGKYYFPTGDYYEGQFKNGKLHGLGKLIKKDGSFSFEGYWENGKK